MARIDDQGLTQATAEDLEVKTPDEVPEWVDCFVSKRQIPGDQGRYVSFSKKKDVWVHKRFLGEFDVPAEEEEEAEEFDREFEDLELGDAGFVGEGAIDAAVEADETEEPPEGAEGAEATETPAEETTTP